MDDKTLRRVLKAAVKTGKCALGLKETLHSMKGSKLIVLSSSIPPSVMEKFEASSVPILKYGGTSIDLGLLCSKPFRISAISIRSPGEADLSLLTKA